MNKLILYAVLFLFSASLFAAPLDGGYLQAPSVSASKEEKARASKEARNKVINAAVKYLNTPYKYGGMTSSGTDCSGLLCMSFKDALGVSLPRSASGLYSWVEKITRDKAQPGDLLFFRTDNTGKITHVALYLGNDRFIHAASAGEKTGVIYSSLSEKYWANAYAGAGRALPETTAGYKPEYTASAPPDAPDSDDSFSSLINYTGAYSDPGFSAPNVSKNKGRLLLGAAIAPTWNGFLKDVEPIRGFASQLRVAAETYSLGPPMIFGLEIRPEYDGALGVFRLPITFSWGRNDKFLIFAGPVFSFGDPVLSIDGGKRSYSGGTSWLGAAGITAAPFIFKTAAGEFAPYLEAAWQYYFYEKKNKIPNADFSAGFRFSSGLRWTIQAK